MIFNPDEIRKDFPLLNKEGKKPIYFDNACMSLKPRQVIERINDYYTNYPACAGRSNHSLARRVADGVALTRKTVKQFIGARHEEEVIFLRNTTEGINLVAYVLDFKAGDIVITSDKEHNSNLVPWQRLKKTKGIIHKVVMSDETNSFNLEGFARMLSDKVKLVAIGHTSNLDGVTTPIEDIVRLSHQAGALVLVDAAQSAAHRNINVHDSDVDFLAFSGHKMLGPTGIGVLYGKKKLLEQCEPFMVGGDTVESTNYNDHTLLPTPEKFEAGLQDYAGIIALNDAIEYLLSIGMDVIHQHEQKLNALISDKILDIPGLKIIGPKEPEKRGGIVSFSVEGIDVHQISLMLDETDNIMIRSGQHCVHSWFHAHSISGTARASLYFYNTEEEALLFCQSLKKIVEVLR